MGAGRGVGGEGEKERQAMNLTKQNYKYRKGSFAIWISRSTGERIVKLAGVEVSDTWDERIARLCSIAEKRKGKR